MRTLYLLRHAKSSWDAPSLADHERPLAPRGRRDAKRIAKHLRSRGIQPELVLCSTAVRTRETLDALGLDAEFEDGLYAAPSGGLLARIRRVPDAVASVMLIGHNPGLQQLALQLASAGDEVEPLREKFPTAALATLAVDGRWSDLAAGGARLTDYVVPKQLR
jgi:phosphohistidine phosphatase